VGRPVLYGLNLGGAQGVASVIEQLNKELTINMMLGGARNIEQVKTTRLLTEKDLPQ
ncbi:lactate oxidase, partial [Salmonella enterica]|nr:lactate oxidase [Salmonella enterica]EGN6714605.1 lactate oxidase [Salmonella enterica subsp. enterica]EGR9908815.1 lactate oxidase [Salmonella enterica subsp. enterica serovar Typhi]EHB0973808.1 lactate oxidase [Salmonella enterica subsp. enterica serovar Typhimurium]EHF1605352.1 lactate oxidase [Salmonella enterica subsp. enterica serovar 4,[5],12:i:-]HAU6693959.1 lactate oxidase [Salmonella enterica subsp. enterica serovar Newport]HBL1154900.1 alpha-hydroxy-acid oxidizing protein [Salmo